MVKRFILGTVNSYLIPGDGGSILIDTGTRAARKLLMEKIKHEKIGAIILTHGHYDHIDNAQYISRLTGAPIYISKEDADFPALNVPGSLQAHTFFGHYLRIWANINFFFDRVYSLNQAEFIRPGDTFSLFGNHIEIIDLSGHTYGSLGILINKENLFVGDCMVNFFTPTVAPIYKDRPKAEHALDTIRACGARNIFPGHGKMFCADRV